jgi:hypothetical protein
MQNDISPMITSFIRYRPQLLHAMDAKQNAFPTPPGWEMVDKKLPHMGSFKRRSSSTVLHLPLVMDQQVNFMAHKKLFNILP